MLPWDIPDFRDNEPDIVICFPLLTLTFSVLLYGNDLKHNCAFPRKPYLNSLSKSEL